VETLRAEINAMAAAAAHAGVPIVGGDTKVVEHGWCEGMYITTFGIGEVDEALALDARAVRPGDAVLLSGPIGDHGITILLARGELDLEADLRSDTRSVWPFVERLIATCASGVRWMRDPTRGGVATALNELARDCGERLELDDARVCARAGNDHSRLLLARDLLHLRVVDAAVFADAVMDRVIQQARKVDRRAVGEMPTL